MRDDQKVRNRFLNKADIPLESVILFMAGMMLVITGALLFPISSGRLEYYENGLYGLLLVIFALQIITMGKTPFGEMRRSIPLLAAGVAVAIIGIATCFVNDLHTRLSRILLFIFFGPGGLLLLLQMLLAKDKYQAWKKYGGIFRQLILGCSLVYVLSMVIGVLIGKNYLFTSELSAAVVLVSGAAVIYLAGIIWKIYGTYGDKSKTSDGRFDISTNNALILMTGIYMMVLGALLIPVNLGLLPFSGSAQLGLLMVLFAIQMLALGTTPLGQFPRSWLMMVLGLLFAFLGIVSCIVPEVLVSLLTVLVGVLNVLGGLANIVKISIPMIRRSGQPREPQPPIARRLTAAQLAMNLLTILFGTSMLISNLIPGLVLGVVLAANGCVLTYMFYLLVVLGNLEKGDVNHVSVQ